MYLPAGGTALAAIVLSIVSIIGVFLLRHTEPTVAPAALGLHVTRESNGLRLSWDHDAPAVRTATRALLWIGDGARQAKLDLDAAQLTGGSIVYWPRSADVKFRMEVFAPSTFASESLRAVATVESVPAGLAAPDVIHTAGALGSFPAVELAGAGPLQAAAPLAAQPADRRMQATTRRPQQRRVVRVPDSALLEHVAEVPQLDEPPTSPVTPAPSEESGADAAISKLAAGSLPQIADPFVSVAVEPVSDASSGNVLRRVFGKRARHSDFVAPTPLRELTPEVPASLRTRTVRKTPIDVKVKVYVDPSGKVQYAEVVSNGAGPSRELATLAVFSSRRWEFVPAHLGSQNVPGEVVIRYRFGPEAR